MSNWQGIDRLPTTPFEKFNPNVVPKGYDIIWSPSYRATVAEIVPLVTFPPRDLVKPGEQVSEIRVYYEILPVLLGLPDFPRSPVQPVEKSYRIGNSATHGRGMFATRQLKSGDLILSERPIIVCPGGVSMPVESRDIMSRLPKDDQMRLTLYHTEEKVRSLFARLDPDQQKRFLALHNCHQHDGSGPLSGISRTNGFGIPKLERVLRSAGYEGETGEPYSSVYDALSYINHSCGPNTARNFHVTSFSMRLYATRDIAPGEEITTAYDAEWRTAASRRTRLAPYGFQCSCPSCSHPKESDARRAIIAKQYTESAVYARLSMFTQTRGRSSSPVALLKDFRRGLDLYEREGLQAGPNYEALLTASISMVMTIGKEVDKWWQLFYKLVRLWIVQGVPLGKKLETLREVLIFALEIRMRS